MVRKSTSPHERTSPPPNCILVFTTPSLHNPFHFLFHSAFPRSSSRGAEPIREATETTSNLFSLSHLHSHLLSLSPLCFPFLSNRAGHRNFTLAPSTQNLEENKGSAGHVFRCSRLLVFLFCLSLLLISFTYSDLAKLKLGTMVVTTTMAGYYMAPQYDCFDWKRFALTSLGTGLAIASANTFNHIIEAELDVQMVRTSNRPLPSGKTLDLVENWRHKYYRHHQ